MVTLSDDVARYAEAVAHLTPATCSTALNDFFTELEAVDPADVDRDDVAAHGREMIDSVFASRVALQARLAEFHAGAGIAADCVTGARRADLAGRYLVDELYEVLPPDGRPADWLVNPAFSFPSPALGLRSGDLIVSRAERVSSAGIAHMGRIDSQFSHNALVWVDADGEPWVIEAYMEIGALVEPFATFAASGIGRMVVLRYDDAALAEKAAGLAFDRVSHGRHIRYDDDFRYDDHKELFCSEVAPWAWSLADGPVVPIPEVLTVFPRQANPGMFGAMGIDVDVTSAPADILFDPRFQVVAEWRDVANLELMRRHDAVVESAMRWMEEDGYVLDVRFRDKALVAVGLAVRNTPVLSRAVDDKLSKSSDLDFLSASLALQTGAEAVWGDLRSALEAKGDPQLLSYDALRGMLEQIRQDDLARWKASPREAHFTAILHPG